MGTTGGASECLLRREGLLLLRLAVLSDPDREHQSSHQDIHNSQGWREGREKVQKGNLLSPRVGRHSRSAVIEWGEGEEWLPFKKKCVWGGNGWERLEKYYLHFSQSLESHSWMVEQLNPTLP